ncbi:tripartite tricarboxylate transporter permease [Modicisalibacter luteus]|uniref:Tripartite tricarboxylate transporter permease n=1 Tax=Modicisalibacter luteus TaxID=453962 RepID=A0ABV7M2S4_9GAMM|nr:tripartite tricarboxylate transporter permease [Halomonas lutea]
MRIVAFVQPLGVIFRSSLIGSLCGALPGVGSITAAFMGYDHARLSSRDSSQFGKGELKGVAAPEAANNAVCGAALIPMVTLGIPESLSVAVIMDAFIVHGLTPGPMLMAKNPEIAYALFILLLISDIVLLLVSLPLLILVQAVVRVPRRYLLPIIPYPLRHRRL